MGVPGNRQPSKTENFQTRTLRSTQTPQESDSSTLNHGLPCGSVGKESTCSALDSGDMGSISELGRSPGGGHGSSLQYSCLKIPMDRGAWQATVHRVTKSQTRLKQMSTLNHTCKGYMGSSAFDVHGLLKRCPSSPHPNR